MRIFLLSFLFFSCSNSGNNSKTNDNDSINGMTVKEWKQNFVDSMMKKTMKDAIFDTVGLSEAPVKVLNALLFKEEYSNYKSIRLTFKNVSTKKIEAIRFKWYGEDSFGDPADMGAGSLVEGFGSGFDDDPLSPGKSRTSHWSILSSRGKKVVLAWAYEVAFSDGNKWKLR